MESYKVYRIHPGIGVARLGNSEGDDHFIGPEVPDFRFVPPPNGKYRNDQDLIRRQGVRFRIYEHTYGRPGDREPLSVREITAEEAEIRWSVHLANNKSYYPDFQTRFPNDPGAKMVDGPGQKVEVHGAVADVPVQLGTLLTDAAGRLAVLGGFGRSGPFHPNAGDPTGIHNAGWYDDTSDGPVRAMIKLHGADRPVEAEPAWVLCGVPAYAAPVDCVVTLYDVAWDVAVRQPGWLPPPNRVSFLRDIYPVLFRAVLAQWVSSAAQGGHGQGRPGNFLEPRLFDLLKSNSTEPEPLRVRRGVFGKLRRPGGGGGNMPLLSGSLSLTPTQYQQFYQWAEGDFVPDWPEGCSPEDSPPHKPFEDLTPWEQTVALDRAGLETTIGGSFNPGIEAGQIMASSIYEAPLRIARALRPGSLTASLSVPWQSDFNLCVQSWWPSARPGRVTQDGSTFYRWVPWEEYGAGNLKMVKSWWEFGFLEAAWEKGGANPIYVETERLLPIPTGFDLGEPPMPEDKLETVAEAEAFARGLVEQALAAPLRSPS